jgi:Sulfotransferase domain
MRKIFCIGLNKTGTVSLHEALVILGYRSLHWGGPETRRAVRRALEEGKPLLTYVGEEFEVFSDLEDITYNFDLADRQYPGSKFILTTRALDDWLASRRRHVEWNQQQRARGAYQGTWLEVDIESWAANYREHDASVHAYFADRPDDLLVMDITAGAGWKPLCEFLGHQIPAVPFPWRNRYGTWREPTSPETV